MTAPLLLPGRGQLLALLNQCNLGLRLHLPDVAFRQFDAFAWLGAVHLRVYAQERRMGPAIHAVGLRRGLSQLGDELRPRAIELLLQLFDLVFQALLLAVQRAKLVAAAPIGPVLLGEAPAVGTVLAVLMNAVATLVTVVHTEHALRVILGHLDGRELFIPDLVHGAGNRDTARLLVLFRS